MQITRGAANPSWRWTDVRDDHLVDRINCCTIGHDSPSNAIVLAATTTRPVLTWEGHPTRGAALILDDGLRVTAYTHSWVDFRPGIVFSLKNRRFDHWTPQYLRYRLQAAIRAALRPEEPSLTPQAVRELDRRLTHDMVGVEWGSGNTTRFFARRTRHLTSFETDTSYYHWVAGTLRAEGLDNVDYRLIPHDFEDEDDEEEMHRNPVVVAADPFADESFDYALIDSAPRGCLSRRVAAKIKPGGLLILDNANWYLPPPATLRPLAPGSVSQVLGTPGSTVTHHECWPAFARLIANWTALWSSNGVQMTLVLIKPRA